MCGLESMIGNVLALLYYNTHILQCIINKVLTLRNNFPDHMTMCLCAKCGQDLL